MNKAVIHSIEDDSGMHCVDIAQHADDVFTFKVFRKDPEDEGKWTLVSDYSKTAYESEQDALQAVCDKLPWVKEQLSRHTNSR
ncbi:hypothetical protein [Herbaspirillum rhizosphaerae]|uniref:hypothetical protein n=1 Tax=Herbaspirillum rhizosphaerae TaxID=346179 RepID=UPI00067D2783|nr:hypothetical protein [Herbaspirillum rhizosphaerae]